MKTQRKIITDRPKISDKEILSLRKPFKEILKNYYSGASMFNGGFSSITTWTLGGLAVLIVGTLFYFAVNPPAEKFNSTDTGIIIYDTVSDSLKSPDNLSGRKINPPFGDYIAFESFKVRNNKKSHKLTTKNGTTIFIPRNAFEDSAGNNITSNIRIMYRDFYNPLDFFLSGIPMDYDSSGIKYTFTSAGMFEINANSEGRQLYLKKGKEIKIEFVSNMTETYNFYHYDTVANKWEFSYREGKSSKKEIEDINERLDYTYGLDVPDSVTPQEKDFMKIIRLVNAENLKVGRADNYAFPANRTMLKDTPFEGIDSLTLEIDDGQDFDENYYSVVWDSVFLQGDAGDLKLVLQKSEKKLIFDVTPCIDKTKYSEAKAKYKLSLKEEKQRIKDRENREKEIAKLNKLVDKWTLTRSISILELGIFNFDNPLYKPKFALKGADITDQNGNRLYVDRIFVTQPGSNTLWNYSFQWLYANPSMVKNIGWVVTRDKKLAIIFPENFQKISEKTTIANVYESDKGIEVLKKLLK